MLDDNWFETALARETEPLIFAPFYDKIAHAGFRSIVEVGCWLGESTVYLATRLPDNARIYAVDLWMPTPDMDYISAPFRTLECVKGDAIFKTFMHNVKMAGVQDKIIPIRCPSLDAAKLFPDNSVDFVFIDGDWRYPACLLDIHAWLPKASKMIAGWGYWETGFYANVQRAVKETFTSDSLKDNLTAIFPDHYEDPAAYGVWIHVK